MIKYLSIFFVQIRPNICHYLIFSRFTCIEMVPQAVFCGPEYHSTLTAVPLTLTINRPFFSPKTSWSISTPMAGFHFYPTEYTTPTLQLRG
jgi:hypothetical protein